MKALIILLGTIVLVVSTPCLKAQTNTGISVRLQDSLEAGKDDNYVVNNVKLQNLFAEEISCEIKTRLTKEWQQVSGNVMKVQLKPQEEYPFALILLKHPGATAGWKALSLEIISTTPGIPFQKQVQFYAGIREVANVALQPVNDRILVTDDNRKCNLNFYLHNKGNCTDTFNIFIRNYYLGIEKNYRISLPPQKDTLLEYNWMMSKLLFATQEKNVITYFVRSRKGAQATATVSIMKTVPVRKVNPFRYNAIKNEIEAGVMRYEKQVTYYGAIKGAMVLNNTRQFDYSYRSKQYGLNSNLQTNIFLMNYRSPKTFLTAGYISDAKHFFSSGTGLRLRQQLGNRFEVNLSGIVAEGFFKNFGNTYSGGIRYGFGRINVSQQVAFNQNSYYDVNSYIFHNQVDIIKLKNIDLSLSGGGGYEDRGNTKKQMGSSWGYRFEYRGPNLNITTKITKNDLNYPGFNKGLNQQYHTIKLKVNKVSLSAFFQQFNIYNNPFRDTVYNTDALFQNTRRYGMATSFDLKPVRITMSLGDLKNTQRSSALTSYRFLELQSNVNMKGGRMLQLSSLNGYSTKVKYNDQATWLTSTTLAFSSRHWGIRGFYNRIPYVNRDTAEKVDHLTETYNVNPYIGLRFFKNLSVQMGCNFFRTLDDNKVASTYNVKLMYFNRLSDFNVVLTGSSPISKSNSPYLGLSSEFYTLTLQKGFSLPFPVKAKYHRIKVRLYKDANNNLLYDPGEELINNYNIRLDDKMFVTNKHGEIQYNNINKGTYAMKLEDASKGRVPVAAPNEIKSQKNCTVNIPFVAGKTIRGRIEVALDSFSNVVFSPRNLKISAADSSNGLYTALADDKGNFFINVPSGVYTVFLNPEAFPDTSFKPDVMSFTVDVKTQESADVFFHIQQKKRVVRFLKTN